jgi:RNA polymerase sigma factor (sigma-70 family)
VSRERPNQVNSPVPVGGAGDGERFRSTFELRYPSIHSYVLRRLGGSSNDVLDVTSQVFAVAWRRRAQIPDPPNDLLWLYGVARKILSRHWRSARRRERLEARLLLEAEVSDQATAAHGPEILRVRAAVRQLRTKDQEILRLVFWEQLSHAEAGEVLGCSSNAVAIRLHKVRRRLQSQLDWETARRPRGPQETGGRGEKGASSGSL